MNVVLNPSNSDSGSLRYKILQYEILPLDDCKPARFFLLPPLTIFYVHFAKQDFVEIQRFEDVQFQRAHLFRGQIFGIFSQHSVLQIGAGRGRGEKTATRHGLILTSKWSLLFIHCRLFSGKISDTVGSCSSKFCVPRAGFLAFRSFRFYAGFIRDFSRCLHF